MSAKRRGKPSGAFSRLKNISKNKAKMFADQLTNQQSPLLGFGGLM